MDTITLTIADGGQGQVHTAKAVNRSLHLAGMTAADQRRLYIREFAEAGIELVEDYLGLRVEDLYEEGMTVAQLNDLKTKAYRDLASDMLDRANRIDGRGL